MNPGVYYDIPEKEYRALDAVNYSSLKTLVQKSAATMMHERKNPKESDAMLLGSAVDCLCLTPSLFDSTYEVANGQSWPNAVCAECAAAPRQPCVSKKGEPMAKCHSGRREAHVSDGRKVLSSDVAYKAKEISNAVLGHPYAGHAIATSKTQVTLIWTDELTGLLCKGRLDICKPGEMLGDLKTCRGGAAHEKAWPKYAYDAGYHIQLAYYSDAWTLLTGETLPWVWVAVETEAPYLVGIHTAHEAWFTLGRSEYRKALDQWAWFKEIDQWPGYPVDPQTCFPPAWASKKVEVCGE